MFKNREFRIRMHKVDDTKNDNVEKEDDVTIEERVAYAMHFVKPVITRIAVAVCCVIACDTVRQVVITQATQIVEN